MCQRLNMRRFDRSESRQVRNVASLLAQSLRTFSCPTRFVRGFALIGMGSLVYGLLGISARTFGALGWSAPSPEEDVPHPGHRRGQHDAGEGQGDDDEYRTDD